MTELTDIIDYKSKAISSIANSKEIMGLLFDDPDISMDGDLVRNVINSSLLDHSLADDTLVQDKTAIFVECKLTGNRSFTVNEMAMIIQIVSPNSYMRLDSQKFKGRKGNRNDNIAVAIVDLFEQDEFEISSTIGNTELSEHYPITAPNGFSAIQLTFIVSNFR